ncbi:hypothetical protein GCM10018777_14170 [Streptomyces albogriseolus]|nr:hypothetical protein GCM10018777_14170 [Streptomyces viridodiastaticus]
MTLPSNVSSALRGPRALPGSSPAHEALSMFCPDIRTKTGKGGRKGLPPRGPDSEESMRPAGVPECARVSLLSQTPPSRHGRHTRAALPSHPRTSPLRTRTGSFSRTTLVDRQRTPGSP